MALTTATAAKQQPGRLVPLPQAISPALSTRVEVVQDLNSQLQAMRSPYMNSVTPGEYQAMEARMRQGGNGASMAQMEQERRAAAQQAAAPAAN